MICYNYYNDCKCNYCCCQCEIYSYIERVGWRHNMDGFERRKELSKENIRRAAEELFSKFGPDKVSINDIAHKAGVSQATIYNNFGSKDKLVHDYHKRIVNLIASRFREILIWKKSYVEKLEGFFQSWIDVADRYKTQMDDSELFGDPSSLLGFDLAKPGDSIRSEIENSFRDFIKEGKEQGNLRSDLSNEAIVTYIRFFQQGIAHNPGIQDRMRRDSKFSGDLLSLFVNGISGQCG